MNIKNILFATDFSENSVITFESAKSLAAEHNAKLLILHVLKDMEDASFHYSIAHLSLEQIKSNADKNIEKVFAQYIDENIGDCVNYERITKHGQPFEEILKISAERSVDLIIVGSHGRTGVGRVVFGSTSDRIVRRSKVPVLVIPGEH